jgi:Holliday junction resolvase RusA-like endonuclease
LRIEVHQLPPASSSPNAPGSVHWTERRRNAQTYARAVYFECVQVRNSLMRGGDFRPFKRPVLQLTFVFPMRRRRDLDNLLACFKSGLDSIVRAGLIKDDSTDDLVIRRLKILVDPARAPLTIIELWEGR